MAPGSGFVSDKRDRQWARRGLVAVTLIALVEWVLAGRAYRTLAGPSDWQAVATHLQANPGNGPLLLAEPWLGPRARMELALLRSYDVVAPPDLHGTPQYRVLSLVDNGPGSYVAQDSRDLPPAQVEAVHSLGAFTLTDYRNAQAGQRVGSPNLLAGAGLRVRDDRGRCRPSGSGYACRRGKVVQEVLEIDFRPRRCVSMRVQDHTTVRFELPEVELGDRLRGHLGFADFNARLRSDAAVTLDIAIDGQTHTSALFSDEQGWAAFELDTTPGVHALEVRVTTAVQGVWNDAGYQGRPSHVPCIELRALAGGDWF